MTQVPSGEYCGYTKTMKPERPWLQPWASARSRNESLTLDGGEPLGGIPVRDRSITLRMNANDAFRIRTG